MHSELLKIDYTPEFDVIASYGDQQVKPILGKLLQSPTFAAFIKDLTSNIPARGGQVLTVDSIAREFASLISVDQMQQWIGHVLTPNLSKNYSSFNVHGLDQLDPAQKYVFISNHRDIIMDPLLLILMLNDKGYGTPHCAIGDNLLESPVSHDLALLNKCFKILRAQQSPKAMLMTLKLQANYIRYLHFVHRGNVWIAQREGRAKDSQDQTNPALVKMLGLACPNEVEIREYFNELKLVPMCYSYEWDPCDIDKARELQANDDGTSTGKTGLDDFNSVNKGLRGHKGQIDLHIGQPIVLDHIDISAHQDIANIVDQFIWSHYQFYPVNYAAHELLKGQPHPACPFSRVQVDADKAKMLQRIENETDAVKQRVLFAYSVNLNRIPAASACK